ncbi:hypothetical protein ABEB36_000742 [Hypothenemus hampei]|uniref:Uncharacterized protein n=1 Tax=Hypothenemus hampei TaxID=57062 RepID=A0ABD1FEY3_HYPHA
MKIRKECLGLGIANGFTYRLQDANSEQQEVYSRVKLGSKNLESGCVQCYSWNKYSEKANSAWQQYQIDNKAENPNIIDILSGSSEGKM